MKQQTTEKVPIHSSKAHRHPWFLELVCSIQTSQTLIPLPSPWGTSFLRRTLPRGIPAPSPCPHPPTPLFWREKQLLAGEPSRTKDHRTHLWQREPFAKAGPLVSLPSLAAEEGNQLHLRKQFHSTNNAVPRLVIMRSGSNVGTHTKY